jgi:Uma2 family endonuclease
MGSAALRIEDLPHYTYDDYFQWEGRWELIAGIPYAMTPAPNVKHQLISQNIGAQLHRLLENCPLCRAVLPVDWEITDDTVVQPDNLVICGENIDGEKLTITPVLVFEITSPSTVRKDRIIKYRLYQEAGVKYYCIVDPESKSAVVFELKSKTYQEMDEFGEGKIIFDLGPCKIAFDFGKVFKL